MQAFFKYWDWGFIILWCCTVKIYAGTEAELTMALLILINVTLFSAWGIWQRKVFLTLVWAHSQLRVLTDNSWQQISLTHGHRDVHTHTISWFRVIANNKSFAPTSSLYQLNIKYSPPTVLLPNTFLIPLIPKAETEEEKRQRKGGGGIKAC